MLSKFGGEKKLNSKIKFLFKILKIEVKIQIHIFQSINFDNPNLALLGATAERRGMQGGA